MALIKCPDCGSDVSTEAPACPKCGRPIAPVKKSSKGIPTGWGLLIIAAATIWIVAAMTSGNSDSGGRTGAADGSAVAERQGCEPSDFVISHMRTSWDIGGGALMLAGVITNNCTAPAGPELIWTGYYGDGSVAFSDEFWPASTVNIAPHQSYHFHDMKLTRPHNWRYTLSVVHVHQW
jgi:hypothetical protein